MADANLEKVIEFLRQKWGENRKCPMCDKDVWEVSGKIFEIREFHGGNLVVGGSSIFPVLPVACTNCGNTVLLSAIMTGFVEKPK